MKELVKVIAGGGGATTLRAIRRKLEESRIECSDEELIGILKELQSEGYLSLTERPMPASFSSYLVDARSWWMFVIFMIPVVEVFLVVLDSYDPLSVFLRAVLGLGLLGFLPGYSSQRALFPGRELSNLERVILSIFLSVVISVSIGVSLGAVYWFTAGPNVFFLSAYVQSVTVAAAYRSFVSDRKRSLGLLGHERLLREPADSSQ